MATIALDATYSAEPQLTGIGVYSRRLIETLLTLETPHRFLVCYRLSRLGRRQYFLQPGSLPGARARFSVRVYQEPLTFWLPWQAQLFHSLAQRPPAFHFRQEIVTVFDIFPITGENYSTADFRKKFSELLMEAMGRAARVITSSHATESLLISRAQVPPEKIRVIPLGVDPPAVVFRRKNASGARCILGGEGEMVLSVGEQDDERSSRGYNNAAEKLGGAMPTPGGHEPRRDGIDVFLLPVGLLIRSGRRLHSVRRDAAEQCGG